MEYLHACMGAPVVKTYTNAIKNNWLTTFPGLTVEAIKQHLPKTIQTTMGHMHRVRQNVQSTQKITSSMIMEESEEEIILEPPRQLIDRHHNVSINTINMEKINGMINTDQTGRFPIMSGQGNTSIMVLYDNDTNVINATAIKSKLKEDMIHGYNNLYNEFKKQE